MLADQPSISDLTPLARSFFMDDAEAVAMKLIGTFLVLDHGIGYPAGGRIVETEAYDQNDPASHCFSGKGCEASERSRSMRLPGGFAYVYADSCLNFVCGQEGFGSAVLVRALEPIWGIDAMKIRNVPYDPRAATEHERLCSGPKRLGWSLGVYENQLDGRSLFDAPFALYNRISRPGLLCGPRVGVRRFMDKRRNGLPREEIEEAAQRRWRYADRSSLAFVSLQTKDRERTAYPLSAL
ncbi:DNA-3-methyladenine glycosylase [Bradyrhizobium diazoefficiens]|uniref:DNA-3-methyladenine glycosylase n=1 Tax=Bradyrhizobium diazoefficiens TaxID=1355477 RepID=UPI0004BBB923|nr:DNA-3-methyladenine glycosylase [Bradyrhizobium diazoefficiens]